MAGEHESAPRAPDGPDEPGAPQVGKKLLEEGRRYRPALGKLARRNRSASEGRRQIDECQQAVFASCRKLHAIA